jgi:mono/diheme cytochrome c family protein
MNRMMPLLGALLVQTPSGCSQRDPLVVPEAQLASSESRARGRALFRQYCALCHGERADGNGVRRSGLSSKPIDFTSRGWRQSASPAPLFHHVHDGVPGTAMPAWRIFSDAQIWDLVAYVLSVSGAKR